MTTRCATGLYLLMSGPKTLNSNNVFNLDGHQSYIDGVSMRVGWDSLEPAPGQYSFDYIHQVISNMQSTHPLGKILLSIYLDRAPEHIVAAAQQTWEMPAPRSLGVSYIVQPVPWDQNTNNSANALLKTLSTELIQSPVGYVRLRHHPMVIDSAIRISVVGLGQVRNRAKVSKGTSPFWDIPGYDRTSILSAIDSACVMFRNAFPYGQHNISLWPLDDGINPEMRLDDYIREDITVYHPHVGGFMENLKGWKPAESQARLMLDLVEQSTEIHPPSSWMQACGAWATHSLCQWDEDDNDPSVGIKYAANDLCANVVEIYLKDIEVFGPRLQSARDYLYQVFPRE